MEMKKGDRIAVTVTAAWADAVGPSPSLHYFKGNDTPTSRLFFPKVVSITHSDGLWVESASETEAAETSILFVPWSYIIAIRSSSLLEADRHKPGFSV
jgi:hypothetical protein